MVSGSDAALNSLFVSNAITSSVFSGSFTGSLFGTASYITGSVFNSNNLALSASYAITASYALNGGVASITVADEGTAQGTATFLNFTGAGVSATVSSNTASINIPGGAGSTFPYTGSAIISGSLVVTGSVYVSGTFYGDGSGLTNLGFGNTRKLIQSTPATTWSFSHNLNEQYPTITAFDSNKNVIVPGRIEVVDDNNLKVYFDVAQSGVVVAVVGGRNSGSVATLDQSTPATIWSFPHNLAYRYPLVNVYDSSGDALIPGRIETVDQNNLNIYFDIAQSGIAVAMVAGTSVSSSISVSSSYALTASYALNGGGSSTPTFPYTGSAIISGSLIVIQSGSVGLTVTGSTRITGSLNLIGDATVTGSIYVTQSHISTVDWIDFTVDSGTPTHNEGRIHWNTDRKTIEIDTEILDYSIEAGHVNVLRGRNTNSYTLNAGTVVYINGNSGQFATFGTASWENDANSAYTIGIIPNAIAPNNSGYAVIQGEIAGINTNAYTPGTLLYLSSSGQYTDQKPVAPLHAVRLGQVVVQATSGKLQVIIDNGYELEELHDVKITSATAGDLLVQSGSLWINSKQLTGSYTLTGSLTAVSGGFTGSLFGTASFSTTAATASSADNFIVRNDITASNGLFTGTITAQNIVVQTVTSSVAFVTGSTKFGSSSTNTHQFTGSVSITGSLTVTGPATINNLTASVFGTSSWAQNSVTASYVQTAQTASYVQTAQTASYVLNAVSSSFASTASYVLRAISSSFSSTASFVATASWAQNAITASYVLEAVSSSFASTASYVLQAVSSSFASTASFVTNAQTASFVATASWANNAVTASYVTGSVFTSNNPALSASYALTASYALNAGGASSITIADEGTVQGTATFLNFTGAGVTATVSSNTASIDIPGGAGSTFPYTGSAIISGSLLVTGSANASSSIIINSSILYTQQNNDVDTGTEVVATVFTGSYKAAFFDYYANDGVNYRAGTVMSTWNTASSVVYSDNSTLDIGSTSGVTFAVVPNGNVVELRATVTTNNWDIKTFVRAL